MDELNYLNQYEKFLTFQKGYSKNTISSYISDIAIFIEFLKKEDLVRALFVLRKALEAYPGRLDD